MQVTIDVDVPSDIKSEYQTVIPQRKVGDPYECTETEQDPPESALTSCSYPHQ